MIPLRSPRFKIRCHPNAWWLNRRFEAITWFGAIHFGCTRDELTRKISSQSFLQTECHEHIHILQARSFRTRYFGFYITYLYYWIRNIFRYGLTKKAYVEIPFEREAYANDQILDYPQSNWRNYTDRKTSRINNRREQ